VHRHGPHHRIDAAFCALAAVGCCAAGVAGDDLAGLKTFATDLCIEIIGLSSAAALERGCCSRNISSETNLYLFDFVFLFFFFLRSGPVHTALPPYGGRGATVSVSFASFNGTQNPAMGPKSETGTLT
jgi:hypothetical protein